MVMSIGLDSNEVLKFEFFAVLFHHLNFFPVLYFVRFKFFLEEVLQWQTQLLILVSRFGCKIRLGFSFLNFLEVHCFGLEVHLYFLRNKLFVYLITSSLFHQVKIALILLRFSSHPQQRA